MKLIGASSQIQNKCVQKEAAYSEVRRLLTQRKSHALRILGDALR